jgi:small subunit ribosomal protein S17
VVVSDKMNRTRAVEVERQFRHSLYDKVLRRSKRYLAHDEANASHAGDRVVIRASRPRSSRKRWEIIEIKK